MKTRTSCEVTLTERELACALRVFVSQFKSVDDFPEGPLVYMDGEGGCRTVFYNKESTNE